MSLFILPYKLSLYILLCKEHGIVLLRQGAVDKSTIKMIRIQ